MCTSMTMRLRSVMLSRVSPSISCLSIGTDFEQAQAVAHDHTGLPAIGAMTMIVPTSPGPRKGRQSVKAARKTAITARMNDFPAPTAAHQPGLVQRICWWRRATGVLGVDLLTAPASSAARTAPPGRRRHASQVLVLEERTKHFRIPTACDDVHSAASRAYWSGSGITSRAGVYRGPSVLLMRTVVEAS